MNCLIHYILCRPRHVSANVLNMANRALFGYTSLDVVSRMYTVACTNSDVDLHRHMRAVEMKDEACGTCHYRQLRRLQHSYTVAQ